MRPSLGLFKYTKLTQSQLTRLTDKKWKLIDEKLVKKYSLPSHKAAGEFVFNLSKVADKMNHHPEINVKYRFVTVFLRTNDINAITDYDEKLAFLSDELKKHIATKYLSDN